MKRHISTAIICAGIILCMVSGCGSTAPGTGATVSGSTGSSVLDMYKENPDFLRTLASGAFSVDPKDAPSDVELAQMLDFAMSAPSGHGLTPWHFVVIRDLDEQLRIFGDGSRPGAGVPTPGTVTVLMFVDNYADQANHVEPYTDWYFQTPYSYIDVGSATSLFNLAAHTLGYRSHYYLILGIPRTAAATDKYLSSKDGIADFTHTVGLYTQMGATKEIIARGNLQFLCTMIVGKLRPDIASMVGNRPDVDARTGATLVNRGKNYNFWDPQNGSAYGKGVPAGQLPVTTEFDSDALSGATEW